MDYAESAKNAWITTDPLLGDRIVLKSKEISKRGKILDVRPGLSIVIYEKVSYVDYFIYEKGGLLSTVSQQHKMCFSGRHFFNPILIKQIL